MSNRTLTAREVDDGGHLSSLQVLGKTGRDNAAKTEAIRPTTVSPSAV